MRRGCVPRRSVVGTAQYVALENGGAKMRGGSGKRSRARHEGPSNSRRSTKHVSVSLEGGGVSGSVVQVCRWEGKAI